MPPTTSWRGRYCFAQGSVPVGAFTVGDRGICGPAQHRAAGTLTERLQGLAGLQQTRAEMLRGRRWRH